MMTTSKPPAPGTPAPSPPPGGPTHPTPTGPGPQRYVDNLFALAATLGADVAIDSGRDGKGAVERASRPVELPSGGGRAGGVSSPAPGAVSGFVLPVPPGPPRFDADGPPRPGHPGPPPRPQPTGPVPHPPPPISA